MRSAATLSALIVLFALALPNARAASIRDGEVLGPSNWEAARGLLPDEILDHYRRGEYLNPVVDISRPGYLPLENPADFQDASRSNRGRFRLSPAGTIVDHATGNQPTFVTGLPFPEVSADDPGAGVKILWNHFYATWYRGDCRLLTELVMIGRRGIERRIATDVEMRMYDGPPEARGRDNPNNLLMQTVAKVVAPTDLNGTVSLTWRYRDPDKHDSSWVYVPGIRHVRQVNPLNRSDGFLGSDISLDDGPFFDGKPEDFVARLVGRQDMLVLVDPYSVRGEGEMIPAPGGGWRLLWKDVPRVGADDPSWKGLPWAPVSAILVKRPVWIVEVTPRDPNYLYGRIVLRLDASTYYGTWASKYDRAGKLLMSYQVGKGAFYTPDGGRSYVSAGGVVLQIAENFLYRRATTVLFPPRKVDNPADFRVETSAANFNPQTLVRLGQ